MPAQMSLLANGRPFTSAAELLEACRDVLGRVLVLAAAVPEHHLHDEFSDRPRTLAEQLGHLAEHAHHLARQLEQWVRGERLVLGRVAATDPDHVDALLQATTTRLEALVAALASGVRSLEAAIERLDDDHLRATVHHVTNGREPLASLLTREIVVHMRVHGDELQATLDDLDEGVLT